MDNLKVLLVTSSFPPEQSGGIGRPYSLYKYLNRFHIEVTVVTVNAKSRLENERNVERYDSFNNWRDSGLFSFKRFRKFLSWIFSRFFSIISDPWWIESIKKKDSELHFDKFDLVYATFPIVEVFNIALFLKKKYNIPFIAEFRDGLSFESVYTNFNQLQKGVASKFESKVVREAEVVVTIGNELSDFFKSKYQSCNVFTVYNGYDPDDFNGISDLEYKYKNDKVIRIAYYGQLAASKSTRSASRLFGVLKSLIEKGTISSDNFRIDFIGNYSIEDISYMKDDAFDGILQIMPVMKKSEGFKFLKENYNYLLFYGIEGEKTNISSKLLEYLVLEKPILGICKGNEAEQIIKRTGTGEISDFDEKSIEKLLLKAVKGEIKYQPKDDEINKFSRISQAEEISDIIKKVIKENF